MYLWCENGTPLLRFSPCKFREMMFPESTRFLFFHRLEVLSGCLHALTESSLTRKKACFWTVPQPSCKTNATANIVTLCTKRMGLNLRCVNPCLLFSICFCYRIHVRQNTPAAFFGRDGMQVLNKAFTGFPGSCFLIGQSATFLSFFTGSFLARADRLCMPCTRLLCTIFHPIGVVSSQASCEGLSNVTLRTCDHPIKTRM